MKRCIWLVLLASCGAPDWPDNAALTTGRVTGTSIELVWPPAVHEEGVDTYEVKRGDEVLTSALAGNTTRFNVGGLDDGVRYAFAVRARASGAWSSPLRLEASTPDVTPPAWKEQTFRVTVESETEEGAKLVIEWGELDDNVGVHEVVIHHRPEPPLRLPATRRRHVLDTVVPDGIWQIEARDKAGNPSPVLAFNVETEMTPKRRANFKERAMKVLGERGRGSDPELFGPDGLGVDATAPTETGKKPPQRGAGPVWLGGEGHDSVRKLVASELKAIEGCYERAREDDPALGGALTVTFAVDESGALNTSRITGLKNASLRKCVRERLAKGRLPQKPEAGFRTDITIHMTPTESE